uniref:ATP-binding cassette domain-containing protein n=1 Tax=Clostridium paraputrificum TaxID=29363 RepID=UPI0034A4FEF6
EIYSKIVAEGKNICIKRGNKTLIKESNFVINKGDKVALIGDNGSGKTSLIKEIINNVDNIKVNQRVKIGYFDQEQKILNDNLTILENIKYNSRFEESFIRICLSGFGFKRDDVHKNVGILSGGEKVKVSLCKVLLDDNNLLILDEPTNYLDINSITALEEALSGTDKEFIIISHDRKLISYICNKIFEIKNCKLITFRGNYYDYSQDHKKVRNNKEDEKMLLRTKLSEVLSRLSIEKNDIIKEKLEKEYNKILEKLNNI